MKLEQNVLLVTSAYTKKDDNPREIRQKVSHRMQGATGTIKKLKQSLAVLVLRDQLIKQNEEIYNNIQNRLQVKSKQICKR